LPLTGPKNDIQLQIHPGDRPIPRQVTLKLLTRPKLLQERHAITCIGFLYITNHDVPKDVISDLKHALPKLFTLDPAGKDKVALQSYPHFLGYSEVGSRTIAGVTDKREQFRLATELPDLWRLGLPLYERLKGLNQVQQLLVSLSSSFIWLKGYADNSEKFLSQNPSLGHLNIWVPSLLGDGQLVTRFPFTLRY
jgi:Isopenicillin N synthase and related dioxygenases